MNSAEQKRLLESAVRLLKNGGILVYTTCSLEPEEDEFNIQWLLDNFRVELIEFSGVGSHGIFEFPGRDLSPEVARCRRFWPDETRTQGFFVAKVLKQ